MLQEKVIVTHKQNKKMRGYIFSEVFLPMTNTETGQQELVPQLGVLWQNPRTPAVSYHHPSDLIWIELEAVSTDIVEYEDEETDDEELDEVDDSDDYENSPGISV